MIYKLNLFVGSVEPFAYVRRLRRISPDQPDTSLLGVCQKILDEAEPILYKNTFHLCDREAVRKLFEQSLHSGERCRLLKIVVLHLGAFSILPDDFEGIAVYVDSLMHKWDTAHPDLSAELRVWVKENWLHQKKKEFQANAAWPPMIEPLLSKTELDELAINITRCRCDFQCCWMDSCALKAFKLGFRQLPKRTWVCKTPGHNAAINNASIGALWSKHFRAWSEVRILKEGLASAETEAYRMSESINLKSDTEIRQQGSFHP